MSIAPGFYTPVPANAGGGYNVVDGEGERVFTVAILSEGQAQSVAEALHRAYVAGQRAVSLHTTRDRGRAGWGM